MMIEGKLMYSKGLNQDIYMELNTQLGGIG